MFKPYESKTRAFCAYPFTRLKVTPDGYATMCCFHTRKCLGNILEKGFEKIWFSPLAEEIRETTLKGNLHQTCKVFSCPLFHLKEKKEFEFSKKMYPVEFEIDLPTQHCNIGGENPSDKNPACIMCERNFSFAFKKQEDRLNEVCLILKPYLKNITGLHIQGIAEAFWKDRIFEICKILGVEKYKNKITVSTTTNGTLMNEARRKKFLGFPLSSLTWSLDAATPETYQAIRRVDMYNKIIENLKFYSRERDKSTQFLRIHNNINLLNINEVVGMVELAAEVGADNLEFNSTYGGAEMGGITVDKKNVHLFARAQERIIDASKKLGVNTNFMRDLTLDLL